MSTPESHPALLFEYSDPGTAVPLETFNAWYDAEHMPAQAAIAGFHTGVRYKAIDAQDPPWLALYDVASTDVLDSAAAQFPGASASANILALLPTYERRVYTLAASRMHPAVKSPHEFLYVASVDIRPDAADALHEWHDGEHTDAFSRVPGWRRMRRCVLHSHAEHGAAAQRGEARPLKYLVIHEWTNAEFADSPEYAALVAALSEMAQAILGLEIRVFELYKKE
ncbi:hypothetical protein B0H10DRAFT_2007252 [Mycena sp. CBHHK59/15]|nr:hypothetical protein B0H10DRAFT_2037752 [Mycena sp. CBHHK59/15]KAJ6624452.1 hypothetical protein B0H10DRAFT_2007252 [Mycena sp. CBHHK59/15]